MPPSYLCLALLLLGVLSSCRADSIPSDCIVVAGSVSGPFDLNWYLLYEGNWTLPSTPFNASYPINAMAINVAKGPGLSGALCGWPCKA